MFNAENTDRNVLIAQVQVHLLVIREAMKSGEHLRDFAESVTADDLTAEPPDGPGMHPDDADDLLEACADAWGLTQLYRTGSDDRKKLPADHNYGKSQRRVIGARPR